MLHLSIIFRMDLSNLTLQPEERKQKFEKQLWELTQIAKRQANLKFALAIPAENLEEISIDTPQLFNNLKKLLKEKRCEILSSGYTTILSPFTPAALNRLNHITGLNIYNKVLGFLPGCIALNYNPVSLGLLQYLHHTGLRTIILPAIQSNSTLSSCYPCTPVDKGFEDIILLLEDESVISAAKYYFEGLFGLTDLMVKLNSYKNENINRLLTIYDGSIPFENEETTSRFKELLSFLSTSKDMALSLPSESVNSIDNKSIQLAELPKTNSMSTRNINLYAANPVSNPMNRKMHKSIRNLLSVLGALRNILPPEEIRSGTLNKIYVDICKLASVCNLVCTESNLNIRWFEQLGITKSIIRNILTNRFQAAIENGRISGDFILINSNNGVWPKNALEISIPLDIGKHMDLPGFSVNRMAVTSQLEIEENYYDNSIKTLSCTFMPNTNSAKYLIADLTTISVSTAKQDAKIDEKSKSVRIKTSTVDIKFSKEFGGRIDHLLMPNISDKPIVDIISSIETPNKNAGFNSIPNNSFCSSISLFLEQGLHMDDLVESTECIVPKNLQKYSIKVPITFKLKTKFGTIIKVYSIYKDEPRVELKLKIDISTSGSISSLRFNALSASPEFASALGLFCMSVNGSNSIDLWPLDDAYYNHDEPDNPGISAKGCLGASEGWIAIGKPDKGIAVITDLSRTTQVPLLNYKKSGKKPHLNLYFSLSETMQSPPLFEQRLHELNITWLGYTESLENVRELANYNNFKPIVIPVKITGEDVSEVDDDLIFEGDTEVTAH